MNKNRSFVIRNCPSFLRTNDGCTSGNRGLCYNKNCPFKRMVRLCLNKTEQQKSCAYKGDECQGCNSYYIEGFAETLLKNVNIMYIGE